MVHFVQTIVGDPQWAFLSVRRTADIIYESIENALLWAMDRPMSAQLFQDIRDSVQAFGQGLVNQGALLGFNCWLDPELNLTLANHRGGGMDAPIAVDMGMEALKSEITLMEWPPELIKIIGTRRRLVLRPGAMGEHDFSADSFVATLGGRWSMVNFGDLKPGSDAPLKLKQEVDYFRLLRNGEELFEIDVEAGKRVIGGVDQLAEMRKAMGF